MMNEATEIRSTGTVIGTDGPRIAAESTARESESAPNALTNNYDVGAPDAVHNSEVAVTGDATTFPDTNSETGDCAGESEDNAQDKGDVTDTYQDGVNNSDKGDPVSQNRKEEGADSATFSLGGDLDALLADVPELREAVSGAINEKRFLELRRLGLSVREAYLATSVPKGKDNRAHIISEVPSGARSPEIGMSSFEMETARNLFDGLSEQEIKRLYAQVTK